MRGFLEREETDFYAWLKKLTIARIEKMTVDDLRVSATWGAIEAARAEVLADVELWRSGGRVPEGKVPLDAGFIDLPERLLAEYDRDRAGSQVGSTSAAARASRTTSPTMSACGPETPLAT